MFRIEKCGREMTCGLYLVDGGLWKLEAVRAIKAKLNDLLGDGHAWNIIG